MKKLMILMMMAGLVANTASAANEAAVEAAENDAEMAKEKADAAVDNTNTGAEEVQAEASDAAAEASADAEEAVVEAEEAPESEVATEQAADGSDNKVSVCKHGDQVRTITLVYNDESSENICQVDYEKSTGVQTLWTAISDKDFCLEKAEAFVQQQEDWGWDCSELQ